MTPDESGIWKEALTAAMAGISGAVAWIWRKVDGAATRQDLKDAIQASEKADETMRESMVKLFDNAEADRRHSDERFSKMQETIHGIHTEVLTKIAERK